MSKNRGYLTLAQGKQRYIDMAIQLAISIRLRSPGEKIAVVTDRSEQEMKKWFDFVIPVNENYGQGLIQKLFLYEYSPFEETLFIDADCLVVRDLNFLWDLFSGHEVSAIGNKLTEGSWAGMDVKNTCAQLRIPYIIQLNGGVYYFKKGKLAENVFSKAQELRNSYDKYGIARLRGQMNEEPLLSLAMSLYHESPIDDKGKGMRTPVGQFGQFKMDILHGKCSFLKHGIRVEPAIMHFGGGYPEAFHYKREVRKLYLHQKLRIPSFIASFWVNLFRNPAYVIYVFVYRVVVSIIKRKRFKIFPLMPMFKFE